MSEYDPSWQFSRTTTRRPGPSITAGLSVMDKGTPNFDLMLEHHDEYLSALYEAGAEITELDPLEDFPDSLFVEDTALCLLEGAIMMRPGAPTRLGEVAEIKPVLEYLFNNIARIEGPGTIEAGNILTTSREVLVGQIERTNSDGIKELASVLNSCRRVLREVRVRDGLLHLKQIFLW